MSAILGDWKNPRTLLPPVDYTLCWLISLLLAFGVVMVYSSSIALWDTTRGMRYGYTQTHYLLRHLMALAIAGIAAYWSFHISVDDWKRMTKWIGIFTIILLILVIIPQIGISAGGARRWLPLGIMQFQPSEMAKLAMVLYAADYSVRKQQYDNLIKGLTQEWGRFFKIVWPMLFVLGIGGALLLIEPDMGAFLLITIIAMGVLFLGGIQARPFVCVVLVLLLVFVVIILTSKFRRERIFGYLNPWDPKNASGPSYQLTAALIALGLGGLFGNGLGKSIEKLNWLPEAHTDFLLAIIGEELGGVAVLCLIWAFFWLTLRIVRIGRAAMAAGDTFAGLVAFGIALWIGGQAFIHIGVNLGALPTKGLTLPLLSFGGSALCMNLVALALVLRIDYETRRWMRGVYVR